METEATPSFSSKTLASAPTDRHPSRYICHNLGNARHPISCRALPVILDEVMDGTHRPQAPMGRKQERIDAAHHRNSSEADKVWTTIIAHGFEALHTNEQPTSDTAVMIVRKRTG